ncbi:MAG: hypothetical protein CMK23_06385 [Porticoccaceae bacterium]|nr:hypothetical protein [Porticoccaceae bacterium]
MCEHGRRRSQCKECGGSQGKRTSRVYRRWTQEEDDALRAGVDKHGKRWADIKNDPTFSRILEKRDSRQTPPEIVK